MSEYLSDSCDTGHKILLNDNSFQYTYNGAEKLSDGSILHKFNWTFKEQEGFISIVLTPEERICSRSLMACTKNQHAFKNTLFLSNDPYLKLVFMSMLKSKKIKFQDFDPFKP